MMKVAVYSAHDFERPYLEEALKGTDIMLIWHNISLNIHSVKLAQDCDAICVFVNDDCSRDVLQSLLALKVKYVVTRSAGFNHIDLEAASELGIRVANVPEYSPYAIAEHTVALMLALNRKLIKAHHRVTELNFSLDGLVGFDMHDKYVGVVGTGKIGAKLIAILHGFGCRVLAVDTTENAELVANYGVQYTDLDTLIRLSDIITLHVPLNSDTQYMINEERLNMMKDNVMLINTSRGGLIDTKAVINALKKKKIGYLGLDVYEEEQGLFFEDHSNEDLLEDDIIARLMTFKNVLITSHQAFLTKNALKNIADTTVNNLEAFLYHQVCHHELIASSSKVDV